MENPQPGNPIDPCNLIDPNFSATLPPDIGTIETSLQTANGRICVGSAYVDETPHYALFRLKDNGDLDTTFGTGGITTGSFGRTQSLAYSVTELEEGSLLVIGLTSHGSYFIDGAPALARFDANGKLDRDFGDEGHLIITPPAAWRDKQPAGEALEKERLQETMQQEQGSPLSAKLLKSAGSVKILVLANAYQSNSVLMKFNEDGSVDTGFGHQGYTELPAPEGKWLYSLNLHASDEGILVCARIYNDVLPDGSCVVSLTSDGKLDKTFGTGGVAKFPTTLKRVENFLVLPHADRIIGCGADEEGNGLLVALTSKGVDDEAFQSIPLKRGKGLVWNQLAAFPPKLADSRILAAGLMISKTGLPMLLGRFHANGKLDVSFAENGAGSINYVDMVGTAARRLEIDNSGKALVHCMSTAQSSLNVGSLIRCLTEVTSITHER